MTIVFLAEARAEYLEAVVYYESIRTGLGQRFMDEVDRNVRWIADHPDVCRLRPGGYHRVNLRTFPYYIPYVVRDSTLWLLAVAHGSRKPEYWIQRKKRIV